MTPQENVLWKFLDTLQKLRLVKTQEEQSRIFHGSSWNIGGVRRKGHGWPPKKRRIIDAIDKTLREIEEQLYGDGT